MVVKSIVRDEFEAAAEGAEGAEAQADGFDFVNVPTDFDPSSLNSYIRYILQYSISNIISQVYPVPLLFNE